MRKFTVVFVIIILPPLLWAKVSGPCSNCHTMHNSQNNSPMVFGNSTEPNPMLLRGDCLGCHAQGGTEAVVSVGASQLPQVYHKAVEDLAGGNFAYITGLKQGRDGGSGDQYGHNVVNIPGIDIDSLTESFAPGAFPGNSHPGVVFKGNGLTCAGKHGCHGIRGNGLTPLQAIKGAHHKDISNLVNGTDVASSYRFLLNVKGYETSDWKNSSPSHHNEYYGLKTPYNDLNINCKCHSGSIGGYSVIPVPPNGTIGEFCATCHPTFHNAHYISRWPDVSSPWLRHPSDYAIPNKGEYADYNNGTLNYSTLAPVARTTWPISNISPSVTPGEDAVTCLSCHYAHAGPYPDMLRWDYSKCEAGKASPDECGCIICHTTKGN